MCNVRQRISKWFFAITLCGVLSNTLFAQSETEPGDAGDKGSEPSILIINETVEVPYLYPSISPWPTETRYWRPKVLVYRNDEGNTFRVIVDGGCGSVVNADTPYANVTTGLRVIGRVRGENCVHDLRLVQSSPPSIGLSRIHFATTVAIYNPVLGRFVPTYISGGLTVNLVSACENYLTSPVYRASIDAPSFDNLYTRSESEINYAVQLGYSNYGQVFRVPKKVSWVNDPGITALWRRFYLGAPWTSHINTHVASEIEYVLGLGGTAEGDEGYVYTSFLDGTVPLIRLNKWNHLTRELTHAYVINDQDKLRFIQQGFKVDGVRGYVCP